MASNAIFEEFEPISEITGTRPLTLPKSSANDPLAGFESFGSIFSDPQVQDGRAIISTPGQKAAARAQGAEPVPWSEVPLELGRQFAGGLPDTARMWGSATKLLSPKDSGMERFADSWRETAEGWSPDTRFTIENEPVLTRVSGALRSMAPSYHAPLAGAIIGGAIGFLIGGPAGIAAFAATGAKIGMYVGPVIMGLSEAQETYEDVSDALFSARARGENKFIDEEIRSKAIFAATINGVVEGGLELAANRIGASGKAIRRLAGLSTRGLVKELVIGRSVRKEIAKEILSSAFAEGVPEFIQGYTEALVRQHYGVEMEMTPFEQGREAFLTGALMGVMASSITAPTTIKAQEARKAWVKSSLELADADPKQRVLALDLLIKDMKENHIPDVYIDAFQQAASEAIENGESMNLGSSAETESAADVILKNLREFNEREAADPSAEVETTSDNISDNIKEVAEVPEGAKEVSAQDVAAMNIEALRDAGTDIVQVDDKFYETKLSEEERKSRLAEAGKEAAEFAEQESEPEVAVTPEVAAEPETTAATEEGKPRLLDAVPEGAKPIHTDAELNAEQIEQLRDAGMDVVQVGDALYTVEMDDAAIAEREKRIEEIAAKTEEGKTEEGAPEAGEADAAATEEAKTAVAPGTEVIATPESDTGESKTTETGAAPETTETAATETKTEPDATPEGETTTAESVPIIIADEMGITEQQKAELASEGHIITKTESGETQIVPAEGSSPAIVEERLRKMQAKNQKQAKREQAKAERRAKASEQRAQKKHEAIERAANETAKALGAEVRVIRTADELPEHLRKLIKKGERVQGLYDIDTGDVYIITEHLPAKQVKVTVIHELVGHKGLRALFTKEGIFDQVAFDAFLERVANTAEMRAGLEAEARLVAGKTWVELTQDERMEVTEEYIARLAESKTSRPGLIRRILAFFKEMARKHGWAWAEDLTKADIEAMLDRAQERLREARQVAESQSSQSGQLVFDFNQNLSEREAAAAEKASIKAAEDAKRAEAENNDGKLRFRLGDDPAQDKANMIASIKQAYSIGAKPLEGLEKAADRVEARRAKVGDTREYSFGKRVRDDADVPESIRKNLEKDKVYSVAHNRETVQQALSKVDELGIIKAEAAVLKNDQSIPGRVRVGMGHILAKINIEMGKAAKDASVKAMHYDTAVDIIKHMNLVGLESGQTSQMFRVWSDTLGTPETAVRYFTRELETMRLGLSRNKGSLYEAVRTQVNEAMSKAVDEAVVDKLVEKKMSEMLANMGKTSEVMLRGLLAKIKRHGLNAKMQAQVDAKAKALLDAGAWGGAEKGLRFKAEKKSVALSDRIRLAAEYAATKMVAEATTDKATFETDLVKQLGEGVRPYLDDIYNMALVQAEQITRGVASAPEKRPKAPREPKEKRPKAPRSVPGIRKFVREYFKQGMPADALVDALRREFGVTEKVAQNVAKEIQQKMMQALERRQERILENIRQRFRGKRHLNARDKAAVKDLLKMIQHGLVTQENIVDVFGEKYGIPVVTAEHVDRITQLAEDVGNAKDGFDKSLKTTRMMMYMSDQLRKARKTEIGIDLWYSSILSGLNTHKRNMASTFMHVMADVTTQIIAEPRNARFAAMGLIHGWGMSIPMFKHALRTGIGTTPYINHAMISTLERNAIQGDTLVKIFGESETIRKFARQFNKAKYVARLLMAEDILFYMPAQEARAAMIAADLVRKEEGLRGKELKRAVEKMIGIADWGDMLQEARREGFTHTLDVQRRAQELIERRRPEIVMIGDGETTLGAMEFARRATFNYQPEGQLGIAAMKIGELAQKVPVVRAAVPFTRILANVQNENMDYTPWALVRLARGMKQYDGSMRQFAVDERAQKVVKAVVGNSLMVSMFLLARLSLDDDEREKRGEKRKYTPFSIGITGNGSINTQRTRQLQNTGWQKYSFRIGGTYIPYNHTPIAVPMAMIGQAMDFMRYDRKESHEWWAPFAVSAGAGVTWVQDQTFAKGLSDLLELYNTKDDPSTAMRRLKRYVSNLASSAIPSLAKDFQRISDPYYRDADTLMQMLLRDTPVASMYDVKINALGDPIRKTPSIQIGWSRQREDAVWGFLTQNEIWIGEVGWVLSDKSVGKILLSNAERYQYQKESGQAIKARIQQNMPNLERVSKQKAQEIVAGYVREERKKSADKIKLKRYREKYYSDAENNDGY